VLAGDAAFVLDPLSSHGVLHAVMSGMMAAEMIAKNLLGAMPAAVTAAAYRRWSSAWFAADVARLRELYAAMPCPPTWARDDPGVGAVFDSEIGASSALAGQ
jgi:flavin-dependent dehydrogenase